MQKRKHVRPLLGFDVLGSEVFTFDTVFLLFCWGDVFRPCLLRTVLHHSLDLLDYADTQSLPVHVVHLGVEDELNGSWGFINQPR